jgi:hypothetical protein
MKNRLLIYLLLIGMGISCSSEKEDPIPAKTAEELAIESLAGTSGTTYSIANGGSIRRNNLDESRFYVGLTLSFNVSGKTYSSSNGDDLFERSGTWQFVGNSFDKIKLSGTKPASGVEIAFTRTSSQLILVFNIPQPAGGRIDGVNALLGSYEIRLNQ